MCTAHNSILVQYIISDKFHTNPFHRDRLFESKQVTIRIRMGKTWSVGLYSFITHVFYDLWALFGLDGLMANYLLSSVFIDIH